MQEDGWSIYRTDQPELADRHSVMVGQPVALWHESGRDVYNGRHRLDKTYNILVYDILYVIDRGELLTMSQRTGITVLVLCSGAVACCETLGGAKVHCKK